MKRMIEASDRVVKNGDRGEVCVRGFLGILGVLHVPSFEDRRNLWQCLGAQGVEADGVKGLSSVALGEASGRG